MLRSSRNTLLALCLALLPAMGAMALAKPENLKPSAEQADVIPVIVDDLSNRHYTKVPLDNKMSATLFDAYLDNLDPQRAFLLQKDVDKLMPLRKKLDDQLEKGDLSGGYDIYNVYHRRVVERMNKAIEILEKDYDSFDFTVDESLYVGTEKGEWLANEKAAEELWRKRIKHSILNLKVTDKSDEEIKKLLLKRFNTRLHQAEQITDEDVFEAYINTYAALYDPHTNYFSPRSLENFNIRMSLSLEGIGAVLSQDDEYTKVIRLIKGGPAEKIGELKRNDKIVAVGQDKKGELVNVIGWRLDEVVDLIRGGKDSWVRLEVMPDKSDDPKNTRILEIQRGKVELEEETASMEVLDVFQDGAVHKIGVIEIPAFYLDFQAYRDGDANYRSTTRDVSKLLAELEKENVEGLVIDLRNNGGGSLLEVNQLIGLFIENGPTVQIRHANMRVERQGKVKKTSYYDKPLVVLTNRLSASASEIFAGAIQDYQRGLVVGGRSFGKGTVQALAPLPHGQLKITQSKYYRISGESTQHRGVLPDIEFPAIYDVEEVGESTLDGALGWDTIAPMKHRYYGNLNVIMEEMRNRHLQRSSVDPDFIYLKDQLALRQQARAIDTVSLNENKRKEETAKNRARLLAIENRRRVAKGLEPLESLDALEDEELSENEEDGEDKERDSDSSEPEDDLYVTESAHILLDMKQLNAAVAVR
jgi:carboxyl-terminal processing protease